VGPQEGGREVKGEGMGRREKEGRRREREGRGRVFALVKINSWVRPWSFSVFY